MVGTWKVWCGTASTTTSASTISNACTWARWNYIYGTACTDSGTTWHVWTSGTTNIVTVANNQVWTIWADGPVQKAKAWQPPQPTEATLAERTAQQERFRVEAEQRRIEQEAANERADALMAEFLDAMQRDQIKKDLAFIVKSETGKTYRIKRGWSHNVEELNADGKVVASYCIHPDDNVPYGDNMLAQKLMLETNEAEFLRVANRSVRA